MQFLIQTTKLVIQTWGGTPARFAYASPCGITVRPTVMPATRSPTASSALYFGIQERKGKRLYSTFFVKDLLDFSRIQFDSFSQRPLVASSSTAAKTQVVLKACSCDIVPKNTYFLHLGNFLSLLYGDIDNIQFRCRSWYLTRVGLIILSCLSSLVTDELPRHWKMV